MVKKRTASWLFLFTFVFFVLACKPVQKVNNIYIKPQCLQSQSTCIVNTEFGDFSVLFNISPVVSETEFKLFIEHHFSKENITSKQPELKIKKISAYLEGKDMFMGKIPLFFTFLGEKNIWASDAILGSCSEEVMKWVMWVTVDIQINNELKKQTFFIEFDSKRY